MRRSGKDNVSFCQRSLESLKPHPFFENLNLEEWARLIYKNLDHHLKQFGS